MQPNKDSVGARVLVVCGDPVQNDEVHSGRSYLSHYGKNLHWGLGKYEKIDTIEVKWIGGQTDSLKDAAADQLITLMEGKNPPK